jgi:hypothetical protein
MVRRRPVASLPKVTGARPVTWVEATRPWGSSAIVRVRPSGVVSTGVRVTPSYVRVSG